MDPKVSIVPQNGDGHIRDLLTVTETWPTTDRNTGRQYQTGL